MSRNTDKINKVLTKYNLVPIVINYMHPHDGGEKQGLEGGWFVETDNGQMFVGLSVDNLIFDIEFTEKWKLNRKKLETTFTMDGIQTNSF